MVVKKAVFPAAGLGTRFLPATKSSPKEMLPLVDKPLIQQCVEEVVASGITGIIIVTGRGKHAIEDHFDISFELEELLKEKKRKDELEEIRKISEMADFFYVRQNLPLGLGHAVLRARDLVGGEDFAVVLGDDIIDAEVPATAQLIEAYEKFGTGIYVAVERVDPEKVSRYGIINPGKKRGNVIEVRDMVEKPQRSAAPSNLAIIGRYILPFAIFDALSNTRPGSGGEIQLTDAMKRMIGETGVYAVEFKGKRYDAGQKTGFLKANIAFALQREDMRKELRRYMRDLVKKKFKT
ncbi:MAG: UTP--glucose-1-phosphate uridylyltransferase GalU [Deltaproteobacteria bacterium]|nr:UTP--glucose-1-phosphate uridylyltransferase GalU [Deltaproteobacteria bacterium]NIS77928.1 UTP--glucose-1-phosphate uridylyltransferase GalU [Deltaproteobacteria bacterium]